MPYIESQDYGIVRSEEAATRLLGSVPFSGRLLSIANEPPPGWRGILTEIRKNALLFEADPASLPLLPSPLPAFCLVSQSTPNGPGSARVSWTPDLPESGRSDTVGPANDRWLPSVSRFLLQTGVTLEHLLIGGSSVWMIRGVAAIFEPAPTARPRLVVAPPNRSDRAAVRTAMRASFERSVRSMPPENDLQTLVRVSLELLRSTETGAGQGLGGASALRLVGFGSGLTPRGDDYLVGFLCGIDLASSIDPAIESARFHLYRASVVRSIRASLGKTSLLGRHILTAAFQGLYSTPLLEEADALSDGIVIGPGEPEWTLVRRPTVSPGWAALLGLLTGGQVALPRIINTGTATG